MVPASTSSASPSPEATHSPGEAEEAHAAAAAPPSLLMSSGEALEADEAPTQPSCSTATQLDPAAIPDGNATRHDTRAADGATASCPPAVQNHPVPAQTPTLPCSSPAEEGRLGAAPMRSPEISAAVEAGPTAQPLSAASQPPTQDQTQPEAPAPSSGGGNVDHAMPAGTGSAWGWGASAWGLQALGGRLQQVAAGRQRATRLPVSAVCKRAAVSFPQFAFAVQVAWTANVRSSCCGKEFTLPNVCTVTSCKALLLDAHGCPPSQGLSRSCSPAWLSFSRHWQKLSHLRRGSIKSPRRGMRRCKQALALFLWRLNLRQLLPQQQRIARTMQLCGRLDGNRAMRRKLARTLGSRCAAPCCCTVVMAMHQVALAVRLWQQQQY